MLHHLQTSTAADLLSFESFTDSSGVNRWTRVGTPAEEWVVRDWDGETYYIRFNKNFSKKHLATFSKDEHRTREAAYYKWLNSGGATDSGAAWEHGEHQLLKEKMQQTVANRAVSDTCTCTHRFNKHPAGGACIQSGCTCPKFVTPFAASRIAEGKPTEDPLAGMKTSKVTFLVLNWVPKAEFESVITQSIQAHEKPPGWSVGTPLAKAVNDEVVLKWDFGAHRRGAVVYMELTPAGTYNSNSYQGCYIKAKKIGTDWKRQTWEIFHMESSGAHAPF